MSSPQLEEMFEAILDGDCERIDELIRGDLGLNARIEGDEWNFLHMALVSVAFPPNPDVVRHLISLGVDVNARDSAMWTPLHFAVRTKSIATVRLIVDAGADLDAVNDEGVSPLLQCLTVQPPELEIAELLLASGANPDAAPRGCSVREYINADSSPERSAMIDLLSRYAKR